MSNVTLEQVIQMADQLDAAERAALLRHLQASMPAIRQGQITLEMVKAEHARRVAAGAFDHARDLADRWARPDFDLSDEELRSGIKRFATEWEQELDELGDN